MKISRILPPGSAEVPALPAAAPHGPPLLAKAGDFYLEAGRMVFTATYHLRRGYCCASRCRHCPYKDWNRT